MKTASLLRPALLIAWLFGATGGLSSFSAAPADPELFYVYHGQKRGLRLDEATLSVKLHSQAARTDAPSANDAKGLARAAAGLGVKEDDGKPLRPGGWITIGTTNALARQPNAPQKSTLQKHKDLVQGLTALGEVEFAAPVFIDDHDKPVHMETAILVGFEDGVSETAQADALRAIAHVKALRRIGHRNRWIVETNFRNGFDLLDEANRVAKLPHVLYAEPNFVVAVEPR